MGIGVGFQIGNRQLQLKTKHHEYTIVNNLKIAPVYITIQILDI